MAKIALDCDGVLADFTHACGTVANMLYPGRYVDGWQPPDWDYGGLYTEAEMDAIWVRVRATPNFWMTLRPYAEHIRALAAFMLSGYGHDVYIVTSRAVTLGETVAMQTKKWLHECGIHDTYNYMGVIPVPDSSAKAGVYRSVGIEMSIDDKAETVEQCDQMKADHRAYLLDRPWNQHGKVKRRVATVEEFLKEVK